MLDFKVVIPQHLQEEITDKDIDYKFIENLIHTLKTRSITSGSFELKTKVKDIETILNIKF